MKSRTYDYKKDGDWIKYCIREAKKLPKEKRQEFMDYLTKERLCIGDAGEKAGLNFDQYSGILNMQIKSTSYLDTEIIE